MVPASVEILNEKSLRFCTEDLVHRCHGPVPYHRDGKTFVVEHRSNGLRWTYTPRPDGGLDAVFSRWDGNGAYEILAKSVLQPR